MSVFNQAFHKNLLYVSIRLLVGSSMFASKLSHGCCQLFGGKICLVLNCLLSFAWSFRIREFLELFSLISF